ncbi:hypothetical protein [Microbacterium dauci]|uniref:Sortase n=1 Tax=Microbacterium dauci TaxID=3048008 RepID=A0ABT6ZE32_9MICO|nr:hypothetical protein [Microbacterium sp. LX3-4]MDJ1114428.1 hypothetical protein [Microbacterium sp. LX3-4]
MKNKISKAAAALAIAAAAVFAAPAVASAYTPVAPGGTVSVEPGQPITLFIDQSALPAADTRVIFTFTGEGVTGANIAIVKTAVTSASVTKPRGSSVTVTVPADGFGDYSLVATGATSGTALPPLAIALPGGGAGGDGGDDGSAAGGDGEGLPDTGFAGETLLGLWVGGGILVLAGASIAVATSVRRARQTA